MTVARKIARNKNAHETINSTFIGILQNELTIHSHSRIRIGQSFERFTAFVTIYATSI